MMFIVSEKRQAILGLSFFFPLFKLKREQNYLAVKLYF